MGLHALVDGAIVVRRDDVSQKGLFERLNVAFNGSKFCPDAQHQRPPQRANRLPGCFFLPRHSEAHAAIFHVKRDNTRGWHRDESDRRRASLEEKAFNLVARLDGRDCGAPGMRDLAPSFSIGRGSSWARLQCG
jgi:hypothetical protein